MRLRHLPLIATSAAAVLAAGALPAVAAPTTPVTSAAPTSVPGTSAYGTYYTDTPRRIFDSRAAGNSALGAGGTVVLTPGVTGVQASAVVVNLTVVNPTTSGYLTAYPSGTARPNTSSINFSGGRTIANLVTVPVGSDGKIVIYNGLGSTDVIVDQLGVYSKNTAAGTRGRGGGYQPTEAARLLDTRTDGGGQLGPGYYTRVAVRYGGTGQNISALAVNITVTNTKAAGYVTAWDGAANTPPRASTLNFTPGTTVANSAVVPTSLCPTTTCPGTAAQIAVVNGSGGGIDVIVDVVGFFDNGSLAAPVRYVPLASPVRIVDSRSSLGMAKLGRGVTSSFAGARPDVTSTVGLDTNVTLVKPTASTYLKLWPAGSPVPPTSTVNSGTGQVISNHAVQVLGDSNRVSVYNYNGTSDVVVDVSGTFENIATTAAKRSAPAKLELLGPTPYLPAATR